MFVTCPAGIRTEADHRSNPSLAICTATDPARCSRRIRGVAPTARPLTNTLAPCGLEVIERSPTNRTGVGGAVAFSVVRAAVLRLGAGAEALRVVGRVGRLLGRIGSSGGACVSGSGSGSTTVTAGCCSSRGGGGGAATLMGTRVESTKISTPTSTTATAASLAIRSAPGSLRTTIEGFKCHGAREDRGGAKAATPAGCVVRSIVVLTTCHGSSRTTATRLIEGTSDLLSNGASIRRRSSSVCATASTRAESSATAPLATRPSMRRTAPSVSVSRAAM
jgi:hypothetical protein